jgi:hypothetical protein
MWAKGSLALVSDLHGTVLARGKAMKKMLISAIGTTIMLVIVAGCGVDHYLMGHTIRPGMTLKQVYSRMGKPDVGFGLPAPQATEPSWLYYEIPFGNYLVVNFDGDKVGKPPIAIESRKGAFVE